jgi:SAM-dependent methyltransferase
MPINIRPNRCPICNFSDKNSEIFLQKNIKRDLINKYSFASRKTPEFMNFLLIKCKNCHLIYACDLPSINTIFNLYKKSLYVSTKDANDAARTYFKYLKPYFSNKSAALEIGSGTGIFLKFLKKNGFKKIVGIEPSNSAIKLSDVKIRSKIIKGVFENIKIKKNNFDSIFCFMTMEHFYYPLKVLSKSYLCLKKKGFLALVIHDSNFFLHKIFKKKSPIIDIEHLQLFSENSIVYALKKCGFKNIKIKYIKNSYRIIYWLSLIPIPFFIKDKFIKIIKILGFSNIRISMNVGNILVLAYK